MSELVAKNNAVDTFKPNAGIGPSNDFGQDDFSLPWLSIAQNTTKACIKGSPEYIPGLEAGMFFNSINNKVYGPSLKVSVIKFMRTYKEVTDDKEMKFIGSLTADQYRDNLSRAGGDYKKARTPAGNLQKEQFNYFVILTDHLKDRIMRLGIGPGGFAACKAWNVSINAFKSGYSYAGIWELTLKYNQNDVGTFFTIGVGSKPSAVRIGVVSGELQHICEGATLAIHENLSRIVSSGPDIDEDIEVPFP